jgi:hypothetical protein
VAAFIAAILAGFISPNTEAIEFEGEVYFNDIFDQINKFYID